MKWLVIVLLIAAVNVVSAQAQQQDYWMNPDKNWVHGKARGPGWMTPHVPTSIVLSEDEKTTVRDAIAIRRAEGALAPSIDRLAKKIDSDDSSITLNDAQILHGILMTAKNEKAFALMLRVRAAIIAVQQNPNWRQDDPAAKALN